LSAPADIYDGFKGAKYAANPEEGEYSDEELGEDSILLESPLDKIDPYITFRNTLTSKSEIGPWGILRNGTNSVTRRDAGGASPVLFLSDDTFIRRGTKRHHICLPAS